MNLLLPRKKKALEIKAIVDANQNVQIAKAKVSEIDNKYGISTKAVGLFEQAKQKAYELKEETKLEIARQAELAKARQAEQQLIQQQQLQQLPQQPPQQPEQQPQQQQYVPPLPEKKGD